MAHLSFFEIIGSIEILCGCLYKLVLNSTAIGGRTKTGKSSPKDEIPHVLKEFYFCGHVFPWATFSEVINLMLNQQTDKEPIALS